MAQENELYCGIGVKAMTSSVGQLIIGTIHEDSKAGEAGLRVGDRITGILNGTVGQWHNVTRNNLEESQTLFRGAPGTQMKVAAYRIEEGSIVDVETDWITRDMFIPMPDLEITGFDTLECNMQDLQLSELPDEAPATPHIDASIKTQTRS